MLQVLRQLTPVGASDIRDRDIPDPLRGVIGRNIDGRPIDRMVVVKCGVAPSFVGALGFLKRSEIDEFLKRNKAVQTALITYWPTTPQPMYLLWFQSSELVPNKSYGSIFWFGSANIPIAVNESQPGQFFLRGEGLPEINPRILKWPEPAKSGIEILHLETVFGPKYLVIRNKPVLNKPFWAALLAKKLQIVFDADKQRFLQRRGDEIDYWQDGEVIIAMLHLLVQAVQLDHSFPTSGITARTRRQLLAEMKVVAVERRSGPQEVLDQFLSEMVEPNVGDTVTIAELFCAYTEYCQTADATSYNWPAFSRRISKLITRRFGRLPAHDLKRHISGGASACQRGFRGLAVVRCEMNRSPNDPPATNNQRTDGTDASDA
jgi:hypothetical protein